MSIKYNKYLFNSPLVGSKYSTGTRYHPTTTRQLRLRLVFNDVDCISFNASKDI